MKLNLVNIISITQSRFKISNKSTACICPRSTVAKMTRGCTIYGRRILVWLPPWKIGTTPLLIMAWGRSWNHLITRSNKPVPLVVCIKFTIAICLGGLRSILAIFNIPRWFIKRCVMKTLGWYSRCACWSTSRCSCR